MRNIAKIELGIKARSTSTAAMAMYNIVSLLLTIFELGRPRMLDFPSVGSVQVFIRFSFSWSAELGVRLTCARSLDNPKFDCA